MKQIGIRVWVSLDTHAFTHHRRIAAHNTLGKSEKECGCGSTNRNREHVSAYPARAQVGLLCSSGARSTVSPVNSLKPCCHHFLSKLSSRAEPHSPATVDQAEQSIFALRLASSHMSGRSLSLFTGKASGARGV